MKKKQKTPSITQLLNYSINHSFTLIEILVVATIIALLAGGAAVSYSQFSKQSRDAKRKADLEQIRAALEMYRSNNTNSSYPPSLTISCSSPGSIADGTNTYLSRIPTDPRCPAYTYYYHAVNSGGGSCNGSTIPCVNYTLAARLETSSSCTSASGSPSCGTGNPCNYCLGPYGQK